MIGDIGLCVCRVYRAIRWFAVHAGVVELLLWLLILLSVLVMVDILLMFCGGGDVVGSFAAAAIQSRTPVVMVRG